MVLLGVGKRDGHVKAVGLYASRSQAEAAVHARTVPRGYLYSIWYPSVGTTVEIVGIPTDAYTDPEFGTETIYQ